MVTPYIRSIRQIHRLKILQEKKSLFCIKLKDRVKFLVNKYNNKLYHDNILNAFFTGLHLTHCKKISKLNHETF